MTLTIKKPSSNAEGFHGILYGEPGTGKTSTADDPEFKTLLLDLEGGSSVLSEATNTDIIEINTWEDLVEAGKSIKQGFFETSSGKVPCTYDMIFIDSITRLQDLCKEYVVRVVAPNRRREIQTKFGAMADWGDLKDLVVGRQTIRTRRKHSTVCLQTRMECSQLRFVKARNVKSYHP